MKQNNKLLIMISGLVLLAALTRLIDHPANFTPIMAIAIFSGTYIQDKKFAILIPITAMIISDLFLGFYTISIFVYLSLILGVLIGKLIQNRVKFTNIILSLFAGSMIFFIITNFASWLLDPMYQPLSFESLQRCYYLAIPFYRNAIFGDIFYGLVLFSAYNLSYKYLPVFNEK